MAVIRDLKNVPKILSFEDRVIFYVDSKYYEYYVHFNFLNYDGGRNDKIFRVLGLDKKAFCNKHYGYCNRGGDWPTCRHNDYEALRRCIIALYLVIRERELGIIKRI